MKKLLVYLKYYRRDSILAPLFKMFEASFELLVPLVVASIVDVGIANRDVGYVIRMCLVMVLLGIIGLLCSVTAQYFAARAAVGFATGVRHSLYEHIQKLSYTEMDTMGTSTLITRMTSDVNQVQSGVNMTLRLFLRSPFIVFGAMIMAFTIDVRSALIFAVTIPALSLVVFGLMAVTVPLYKSVQAKLDGVLGITRENLTGIRVLRAFGKEQEEEKRFTQRNRELTESQLAAGRISALMNPLTYVIINVAVIVLLWVSGRQVWRGSLTQGDVIALVNYMSQILIELVKLANLIVTITKALACANRISAVLETESSMKEEKFDREAPKPDREVPKSDWKEPKSSKKENWSERRQKEASYQQPLEQKLVTNTPGNGEVRFSNVSMLYKNAGEESLSDITFHAKPGQTIGITGGTGSGKSSLVNLIPRFYDVSSGAVMVDGKDVRDYPLQELRKRIGVVPQKAVLFKGTIRDNLLWGKKGATEDEMWEALEYAQAKEFVVKKERGLDEEISQGGKNLSGGQRQRLTIARALIRKAEILIMDDSASALDYATDAALRNAICGMKEKLTVFIVSQRAASIQHADQIIVLDDGKVMGIGTHEQLLASCEVYQEIYYSQFPKEEP